MVEQTINNAQTIVDDCVGAMLAKRYRVVKQLGHGGMGSVWLAEDTLLDNKGFGGLVVDYSKAYFRYGTRVT